MVFLKFDPFCAGKTILLFKWVCRPPCFDTWIVTKAPEKQFHWVSVIWNHGLVCLVYKKWQLQRYFKGIGKVKSKWSYITYISQNKWWRSYNYFHMIFHCMVMNLMGMCLPASSLRLLLWWTMEFHFFNADLGAADKGWRKFPKSNTCNCCLFLPLDQFHSHHSQEINSCVAMLYCSMLYCSTL